MNNLKLLIFSSILVIYSFILYSKNGIYALVGKVINAETGEPLWVATSKWHFFRPTR